MRLGDLDDLKVHISELMLVYSGNELDNAILNAIDNAQTVNAISNEECYEIYSKGYLQGYKRGKSEIPQGGWIPVSERLPNDRDWCLGIFQEPDTGFVGIPYICDYVGKVTKGTTNEGWILRQCTDVDSASDYFRNLICIAWRPLPKPYELQKGGAE